MQETPLGEGGELAAEFEESNSETQILGVLAASRTLGCVEETPLGEGGLMGVEFQGFNSETQLPGREWCHDDVIVQETPLGEGGELAVESKCTTQLLDVPAASQTLGVVEDLPPTQVEDLPLHQVKDNPVSGPALSPRAPTRSSPGENGAKARKKSGRVPKSRCSLICKDEFCL